MREATLEESSLKTKLATERSWRGRAILAALGLGLGGALVPAAVEAGEHDREGQARPMSRWAHAAAVLDGRIYVIGGAGGDNKVVGSTEAYDPATGTWSACADMPTPRFFPISGEIDGRIWVVGGVTSGGPASTQEERMRSRKLLSVVEVYDPARGRWTTETPLATARGWFSASVVNRRIYVFGGRAPAPDGGILEVSGAVPGIEVYPPGR